MHVITEHTRNCAASTAARAIAAAAQIFDSYRVLSDMNMSAAEDARCAASNAIDGAMFALDNDELIDPYADLDELADAVYERVALDLCNLSGAELSSAAENLVSSLIAAGGL